MGPSWVLSAPNGPSVGPMNLAIRVHFRVFSVPCQVPNPFHSQTIKTVDFSQLLFSNFCLLESLKTPPDKNLTPWEFIALLAYHSFLWKWSSLAIWHYRVKSVLLDVKICIKQLFRMALKYSAFHFSKHANMLVHSPWLRFINYWTMSWSYNVDIL